MSSRRVRLLRLAVPVAVASMTLATLGAVGASATAAPDAAGSLSLVAPNARQKVLRYKGDPADLRQLAVYGVADGGPVEFRIGREKYSAPVGTTLTLGSGENRRTVTLPDGATTSANQLTRFLTLTVHNTKGAKVFGRYLPLCLNTYSTTRYRPDAPAQSPYAQYCGNHPFALGSLQGLQDGWSAPLLGSSDDYYSEDFGSIPFKAKNGKYTATVGIAATYREALGLSAKQASVKVPFSISYGDPYDLMNVRTLTAGAGKTLQPNASRPDAAKRYATAAVDGGLVPDLRALPAYGMGLARYTVKVKGKKEKRTYLEFGATVWNAGPSPLVVDGFRRPGKDLMDAYQYFFDGDGNQVGSAPAGSLEWDARRGHTHWHFTDFARYSLLDSSKKTSVVSGKEAFCLAPTDPVDTRVENAKLQPASIGLDTACGGYTALGIREVLDVGWGDTYEQYRPGQSLNVTNLPKGIYYVSVQANPKNKLAEVTTDNNTALRKVGIGGKPGGKRTLKVYPYQGITTR